VPAVTLNGWRRRQWRRSKAGVLAMTEENMLARHQWPENIDYGQLSSAERNIENVEAGICRNIMSSNSWLSLQSI